MKIAFVWQGLHGRYGQWKDGLYAAMQIIEQTHTVLYFDPLSEQDRDLLDAWEPDAILYWEAPVTQVGKDSWVWDWVCSRPAKKYLLFAGGEIKPMWVKDFELLFVESAIDEDTCERFGIPYKRAFGVNTQIMKPRTQPKVFDGFMQATFAGWKRHELFADALGSHGAVAGRYQEHDRAGYEHCLKKGVLVLPELPPEAVESLINASHAVVNTAEFWGGGQRCTLEAMACGVPVLVMDDSPKNCEYVDESQAGMICAPITQTVKNTVEFLKNHGAEYGARGVAYVHSKWTEQHYADAIMSVISPA